MACRWWNQVIICNVIFTLERRQVNFNVDQNNLLTNIMNSGFGNMLLSYKGNIKEHGIIEQIMKNVD